MLPCTCYDILCMLNEKKSIYNKRRKEISVFFDLLWVRQTSVCLLNYSSSVLYQKIQQGILITPEPGYSYDRIIGQVDVSAAGSRLTRSLFLLLRLCVRLHHSVTAALFLERSLVRQQMSEGLTRVPGVRGVVRLQTCRASLELFKAPRLNRCLIGH